MRFKLSIAIMFFTLCAIATQSTSNNIKEISWNETRKQRLIHRKKTSQYAGVYLQKQTGKWVAKIYTKQGKKQKYSGFFDNELDAAKKVNQLCEELGIPVKNPGISGMPNQEIKEKTSQYAGVYLQKQTGKWHAVVNIKKEKKQKYGGGFSNELDAAKKVNQMCEELGMPPKNPEISGKPNQEERNQKQSQYKGVSWHKASRKWRVQFQLKGQKQKHGRLFTEELDAAKRVNQICEECGIPPKNPGISRMPNQHDNNQIIDPESTTNPTISFDTTSDDEDDFRNENKRKRKKDSLLDNKPPAEQYYFYDDMLK